VYRALQFHEHRQYFIGANDESLSVAMRVNNPNRSPSRSSADTQPKLHPAL